MMEGAPPFGWDFAVFWAIGRAILDGSNAYAVWGSWYPPATSILFSLFALANPTTTFVIWSSINIVLLSAISKRKPVQWLLYAPTLFVIAAGQIDLMFLWLTAFLNRRGWTAAFAAAVITLKPQVALILLPWWLINWLVGDRRTLARFIGASAVLHGLPLLYDPAIYGKWFARIGQLSEGRASGAPSLIGLTSFNIPAWLIVSACILLVASAWAFSDEKTTRAALAMSNPAIMMYDHTMLIETAPWWLMVPVSWLAYPLCYAFRSFVPFLVIPLAALTWRIIRRSRKNTDLLNPTLVGIIDSIPAANMSQWEASS